jgi:hypothetical protein
VSRVVPARRDDKSLARPTSRYILFDGENISFDATLVLYIYIYIYRHADKSLARPTSRCILFDGKNISFDASLVIYINSINILPIMIINRIYGHQNLLLL